MEFVVPHTSYTLTKPISRFLFLFLFLVAGFVCFVFVVAIAAAAAAVIMIMIDDYDGKELTFRERPVKTNGSD